MTISGFFTTVSATATSRCEGVDRRNRGARPAQLDLETGIFEIEASKTRNSKRLGKRTHTDRDYIVDHRCLFGSLHRSLGPARDAGQRRPSMGGRVQPFNMNERGDSDLAVDDPSVARHLSAELRDALRALEVGDEDEVDPKLLAEAAAIVNAFAAAGVLEFAYIPPEDEGGEDDVAVFGVSEAAVIEDAPDVISLFGYLDRATDPVPRLAYEKHDLDDEPSNGVA